MVRRVLKPVAILAVLSVVYYLIFWREWTWVAFYPFALLALGLGVVFLVALPIYVLGVAVWPGELMIWRRLLALTMGLVLGLVGAATVGLVIDNEFWHGLVPWIDF